jgi:hypothetical protein
MALPIDLATMSDAQDRNYQTVVFNFCNDAVISNSVFPEFAEALTPQSLSNAAGIPL